MGNPAANGADGHVADVYDRYGAAAFALCVAITGDRERSADIVVDCFRRCRPASDEGLSILDSVRREAIRSTSAGDGRDGVPEWLDPRRALNAGQRHVLALVYLHGLDVHEVAARIHLTPHEAAGALAEAMSRYGDPAGDLGGRVAAITNHCGDCAQHEPKCHSRKGT